MIGGRLMQELTVMQEEIIYEVGRGGGGVSQAFEISACKAYTQLGAGGHVVQAQECKDMLVKAYIYTALLFQASSDL